MDPRNEVMIFPLNRQTTTEEEAEILDGISSALSSWSSHGRKIDYLLKLEESQFLVFEFEQGSASGCGKDALQKMLNKILKENGIGFHDPGYFFVRVNGKVISVKGKDFKREISDNMMNEEFLIYPVWISTSKEYNERWKKSIGCFPEFFPKEDLV